MLIIEVCVVLMFFPCRGGNDEAQKTEVREISLEAVTHCFHSWSLLPRSLACYLMSE